MIRINWNEFKEFKKNRHTGSDNFNSLLEFVKSYYNMVSPREIFETFQNDDLAQMMLEKRDITDAEALENYLFKMIHE